MLGDIIRESPVYQEAVEQGMEKGLVQGREEGRQEERLISHLQELQRQRKMLLDVVATRFPQLVRLAKILAASVEDPDILPVLIINIMRVQTVEEAKQLLVDMAEDAT